MLNVIGNVVFSEYDEFLLSQISLTEEESMIHLLSQSQLTQITLAQEQQQLVDLVTQNTAQVVARKKSYVMMASYLFNLSFCWRAILRKVSIRSFPL
jgi:hypothetical protein